MKCTLVICVTLAVILCVQQERGNALPANGNGTNKFDFGTGPSTPAIGSTFDEIVVQSNLQVRGKSPSGRSRNFPTTKSDSTKSSSTTTAPEPKP
ncbi:hypothetical protein V9T40_011900 [Parthenolecanium corni]|uniref:Uncharacterized protein n=1 Tax=Parthenolecanium corni TaxID=536013 RepID=A0AAN9XYZ6_9HEMI